MAIVLPVANLAKPSPEANGRIRPSYLMVRLTRGERGLLDTAAALADERGGVWLRRIALKAARRELRRRAHAEVVVHLNHVQAAAAVAALEAISERAS